MGYEAEKNAIDRKIRRIKRIVFIALACVIAALCILGVVYDKTEWKYRVALPKTGARSTAEMRIHFIAVGQGDATVVELPDGKILLADGGNGSGDSNKAVLRHLNALKVETIDYLFLSRVEAACFGGLNEVLRYKRVNTAYLPQSESESVSYISFLSALRGVGAEIKTADRSVHISQNGYAISVLYPVTLSETASKSAVVWLGYKGVHTLLASPVTTAIESELTEQDGVFDAFSARGVDLSETDILKVAVHGGAEATGAEFLNYLGVRTAIVSCASGNNARPAATVISALKTAGVKTYRTDRDGSVIVTVKADGAYTVRALGA